MHTVTKETNPESPVLMALSGGVDSAVSVRILQQQGFRVQGAVIRFSPAHDGAVLAAQIAAEELGIPLHIIDAKEPFEKEVILPFCTLYASGRTPSPCLLCNPAVKFRMLQEKADELGFYWLASGHYANCESEGEHVFIAQAESKKRDQSYMLYRLPQSILRRLILPLGTFEKPHIREMAEEWGLSNAKAPDSQEICFIPNGNHADYIKARGIPIKQGNLIGPDGQNLGPHRGVAYYTIGQRKGLGVSLGEVVFVQKIEQNGDVILARAGDEFSNGLRLHHTHNGGTVPFMPGQHFNVKIRSAATPVPCEITHVANDALHITFDCPQRAAAPGQHAVLYKGSLVIGGGEIEESF